MFEEIEDFLNKNKHPLKDDDGEEVKPTDVIKALKKGLGTLGGSNVEVRQISKGEMMQEFGLINTNKLDGKFDGIANALIVLGKQLNAEPECDDANGRKLFKGEYLKCDNKGSRKKVLEVGYGFCRLSRTDDHNKDDGIWFANEIKKLNFIKE